MKPIFLFQVQKGWNPGSLYAPKVGETKLFTQYRKGRKDIDHSGYFHWADYCVYFVWEFATDGAMMHWRMSEHGQEMFECVLDVKKNHWSKLESIRRVRTNGIAALNQYAEEYRGCSPAGHAKFRALVEQICRHPVDSIQHPWDATPTRIRAIHNKDAPYIG